MYTTSIFFMFMCKRFSGINHEALVRIFRSVLRRFALTKNIISLFQVLKTHILKYFSRWDYLLMVLLDSVA